VPYKKEKGMREATKSFSVNLPVSLAEEVDRLCASNYITRTSFLIKAARVLLEKERREKRGIILGNILSED